MSSAIDRYNQEKKLAGVTTRALSSGLRNAIDRTTNRKTGTAVNEAGSRAVFKDQRLQRVTLRAPHYIFKQHYGFEGNKKNAIMMRLRPTDVLTKAIEQANVLETLADGIAEIRMDEVTARINFK
jgi:hypothetical protein